MTFNEGMRIDTSTTSTGGGAGRGIALGGGVGGLAIVLLALFLGVDPGPVLSQQQIGRGSSGSGQTYDLSKCRTGADANKYDECRVVATGNSVDGVWEQLLPGYRRPAMKLFRGNIGTGCGPASSDVGPFYCPADRTAYFDTDFFTVLEKDFGSSGGPLAKEYVVAHEYGHHVQNLTGDLNRAQQGVQGSQGNGVRSELQADCYAGVWAHFASTAKQRGTDVTFLQPLTDKDINDALLAASSVGDDRIQEKTTGRINQERWTHGSSEQRQRWFTVGYQTGDPNQCDTFSARDLG